MEWVLSADQASFTLFAAVHDTANKNDGTRNGIYVTRNEGGVWDKMAIDPVNRQTGKRALPPEFGSITLGADHTPGSAVAPIAAISKKDADWRHALLLNVFQLVQGTWNPIGAALPAGLDTQGGANQPIIITPTGAIYLGVSGNYSPAFFQSLDSGLHWTDISTANGITPHVDHHGLLFTDGTVYDGNDGGIWRFTPSPGNHPGGKWEHLNTNGLQTIEAQGVSLHPKDPTIVLVGSQDNGTTLRFGGIWKSVQGGDRGRVHFDIASTSAYSETYGGFDRSDDSGASWNEIELPGDGEFAEGVFQNYDVDPFGSGRLIIAGVHGTWISRNKGDDWTKIAPSLTGEPNAVSAMAFSSDPGKIYLAFADGRIFRTSNSGGNGQSPNWTDISGGTKWGGMIIAMAVDPSSPDTLYLATSGAATVWRTVNAGGTWEDLTSDLPNIGITSPLVLANKPSGPYVFVGTPSGVYGCANPANPLWRRIGAGLPFVQVTDLQYQAPTDMLAAATYGRGIFVGIVGDISPPQIRIDIPKDECNIGPLEGQTVGVHGVVLNANPLTTYSFEWSTTGQLAPGENGKASTLKVIAPSTGELVQLTLTVRDTDGLVGTAYASFTPISLKIATWVSFVCHLKYLVKVNLFVDPLWDPLRDFTTHPVTQGDLRRVLGITEQLAFNARAALSAFDQAHQRVKIGHLPTHVEMNDRSEERERGLGGPG